MSSVEVVRRSKVKGLCSHSSLTAPCVAVTGKSSASFRNQKAALVKMKSSSSDEKAHPVGTERTRMNRVTTQDLLRVGRE